jgi:hypothetical protein
MIYEYYFDDEENAGPPTLSAAHSSTITTQRVTHAKDSSSEISPEHNDQSEGEGEDDNESVSVVLVVEGAVKAICNPQSLCAFKRASGYIASLCVHLSTQY